MWREARTYGFNIQDGCAIRITIQWGIAVLFSYFPKIRSRQCNSTEKFLSVVGSEYE